MKKVIRLLDKRDAAAYEKLLKTAFGSAHGFTVRDAAIRWGFPEEYYPTLGVFHDDILVSTMRAEWVLSQRELDFKIFTQYHHPEMKFPAMYLTKAGTQPGIKARGLNTVLRYLSFQLARQWGVRFIFGLMVEGSPRVFSLEQMGYEFIRQAKKWNGNFISEKYPMLAVMDLQSKGKQAFQFLEERSKEYLKDADLQIDILKVGIKDDSNIRWPWSA